MSATETRFGQFVCVKIEQNIAVLTLDCGDGYNAMSRAVLSELTDAAIWLSTDTTSSVVILTGVGGFSAGADLKDPDRANDADRSLVEKRQLMRLGPDMCDAFERLEQITICAIERFCIGGGVALAIACDHRIIGQSAHLRLPEIPLGMNMSWHSNPRTVSLIGPSRAKQFTILGEKLPAETALQWGLVDRCVKDGETFAAALALAERYAGVPPLALRMTKQAINAAALPLGQATSFMDRDQFAFAATSADQSEAVRAFLEKRPAKFTGN